MPDTPKATEPPPIMIPLHQPPERLFVRVHPDGGVRLFLRRASGPILIELPPDAVATLVHTIAPGRDALAGALRAVLHQHLADLTAHGTPDDAIDAAPEVIAARAALAMAGA